MIASFVLPGLGQLGQGRYLDAALFLALSLWLRLVLASYGWILTVDKDALGAALWGVLVLPEPSSAPLAVVCCRPDPLAASGVGRAVGIRRRRVGLSPHARFDPQPVRERH